jgi:hypothetical protein
LANQQFHQRPGLYGSLISLLQSLIDEFNAGQNSDRSPQSRRTAIIAALDRDALDAEFAKPEELLDKLNTLHTAWFNLSEMRLGTAYASGHPA